MSTFNTLQVDLGAQYRYLLPVHPSTFTTSMTNTVGRVYLMEVQVPADTIVDAISFANVATVAGNIRVGLYGPVVTEDTPLGAPLLAESASTAQTGTSTTQTISFTAATLARRGRYYAAIQFDDATATVARGSNSIQVPGAIGFYDRGGGYGAFTNPCPTPTMTANATPGLYVRCQP